MVTHTPATPAANATTNKRRWLSGDRLRNQITGMLFVTPATLLIGVFGLFPISYAIYMSLHSWRIQRRYTLCLPDFAANWRAEAPVWEKDFATEIVPNFNLGACFDNYTKVVGDWGGVFLWILGFIGLFSKPAFFFLCLEGLEGRKPDCTFEPFRWRFQAQKTGNLLEVFARLGEQIANWQCVFIASRDVGEHIQCKLPADATDQRPCAELDS